MAARTAAGRSPVSAQSGAKHSCRQGTHAWSIEQLAWPSELCPAIEPTSSGGGGGGVGVCTISESWNSWSCIRQRVASLTSAAPPSQVHVHYSHSLFPPLPSFRLIVA